MHFLGRLISITISYSLFITLIERAWTVFIRLYVSQMQQKQKGGYTAVPPAENIQTLDAFEYRAVEPIKYRPFETKHHVTMGIKKSTKQDWIRIDRNYLERTVLRKKLLAENPEVCLGTSETANPAIRELYEEVMLDLLPKRFPTMFQIKGDVFYNLVNGTRHRISSALLDHTSMLRHLAENVEEDFYFMVPDAQDEFVLQGFIACFPQGLLPSAKVGMSVGEIHKPVPGYEGRLKKGVNRCFERMARGQSVGRLNWAIQGNHSQLFLPFDGANTIKTDDSPSAKAKFDPAASFLRVEHHTLTCLPRTGTIVFAVRSYMTPLTQIRDEGSGPTLAEACDAMPEKFGVYKNRPTWGQSLCAWLREEDSASEKQDLLTSPATISTRSCPFAKSREPDSSASCPFAP
ncbi:MAG: hypothetical protein ASARMPREDX12_005511 [Alectoria sarmentosa]|nr:MAG: hypothetical protein ASARMPREDX12_005511 [Alectoria sarmentosa]